MSTCCNIDSVLTLDDRGQIIIPKDIRKKFDLSPGDKLALVSCEEEGELCCFTLIKTDRMKTMVKSLLGPMFDEIVKKD